ncbi:MAG: hypothetical protein ACO1OF_02515 [Adhaeribacter sp.]
MNSFEIHTEAEYKTAEARLEIMAGAIPGTEEATELKHLTKAVVDYLKKQEQVAGLPQDMAHPKNAR